MSKIKFRLESGVGKVLEKFEVPTGHICIMEGELGKRLEFLSIGDYGKEKNVKADFLGYTNEVNGVEHCDILPLEEKWVITISSQYGCSMACGFCDVPKVGVGINATFTDMVAQVLNAISLHPEVHHANRINLHYARMGEPTWNKDVIDSAYWIGSVLKSSGWGFHPVVSTMMPNNNKDLFAFLEGWLDLKDNFNGEAGLQLSINTTDEIVRKKTMPYSMSLKEISDMMCDILSYRPIPLGRKITLNFALTNAEVDASKIRDLFSPRYFICKLTPMHKTKACVSRGLLTDGGYDYYYPYKKIEEDLKKEGFGVIVFVPSKEEDNSRITCGNAILADMRKNEEL